MKGVVFTEFLEMVEDKFSADLVDEIIEESNLNSGGVYTTVGTYDHGEMIQLVGELEKRTGVAAPDLLRAFGEHLFGRFAENFPAFFENSVGALEFLASVDEYIHVEVRKLYPDAELPSFVCHSPRPECLEMTYRSNRPFATLAEGLIRGCIGHYGEPIDMQMEDLSSGEGTAARFVLTKTGAAP